MPENGDRSVPFQRRETIRPGPRPMLTAVVADDFDAARHLFIDALNRSGHYEVVATAANGSEAVAAVESYRPDLALLDLAMPVAGGLDVIEELNERSPSTRVVIVSGFPGRGLETLALGRGAAAYIRKQPSVRAVIEQVDMAAGLLDLAGDILSANRTFPSDLSSAGQARRFLAEVVNRWDCEPELDVLRILISEAVANAVVHAGSEPDVSVRLLGPRIRIEVSDDSEEMPSVAGRGLMAESGRGLAMIASEAEAWGVEPRPGGGKTVWFELPSFVDPDQPPS